MPLLPHSSLKAEQYTSGISRATDFLIIWHRLAHSVCGILHKQSDQSASVHVILFLGYRS